MSEREEFETSMGGDPNYWHKLLWTKPNGEYRDPLAIGAWIGWQAARANNLWISVDDRLPEHEAVVLATGWQRNEVGGKRYTAIACFHREGVFYEEDTGDDLYPPTHWQPLPSPPA